MACIFNATPNYLHQLMHLSLSSCSAGSASIAHSAVKTKYSASEGLVALLEPFIDTVVPRESFGAVHIPGDDVVCVFSFELRVDIGHGGS